MESGGIFWLIFLLMMFQPMLQKHLLETSRRKVIHSIERKRNSRVIVLAHRQETMSFFGFPLVRYIDLHDSEQILRALRLTDPELPVDLVLHTPGGLVLAASQIARAIKKHPGKVTVFVPHYAMSGGTLIALAADEIVMTEHAVLGPVDPQLGQYAAASILKVMEKKPVSEVDDQTIILADQSEKAIAQVRNRVKELLADRMPDDQADEVARMLSEGRWTHDHPITVEDARSFGLNVSTDMPQEFLDLMTMYPQPVRQQPSVEYLPFPYRSRPGNGADSRT